MARQRDKTRRDRSNERKLAHEANKVAAREQREREAYQKEFTTQLRRIAASGLIKVTVNTVREHE